MQQLCAFLLFALPSGALAGRDILVTTNGADALARTDSTAAFEAAIRASVASDRIVMGNGRYIISRTLILKSGTSLVGYLTPSSVGELIWNGAVGGTMLQVGSSSKVRDVTLDGRRRARVGLELRPSSQAVVLEGIEAYGFRGTTTASAYGIHITPRCGSPTVPVELKASVQRRVRVSDIDGPSNGKQGDWIGANRGIYVNRSHATIDGCVVDRIGPPEDGDAIHIQADSSGNLSSTVANCVLSNFQKRGIKVQASGARLVSNFIFASSTHANAGIEILGSPTHPAMDIVVTKNHIITSSTGTMTVGIGVAYANTIEIDDNQIDIQSTAAEGDNGVVKGIYLYRSTQVSALYNVISRSSYYGFYILDSSGNTVRANRIDPSIAANLRIRVEGNSINNQIQGL